MAHWASCMRRTTQSILSSAEPARPLSDWSTRSGIDPKETVCIERLSFNVRGFLFNEASHLMSTHTYACVAYAEPPRVDVLRISEQAGACTLGQRVGPGRRSLRAHISNFYIMLVHVGLWTASRNQLFPLIPRD